MSDLQRTLASLHDALRSADRLDADDRVMLESALAEIRAALGRSTDADGAALSGDALEDAAVRLEAGHPGLAGAIRALLDALAKAGI
jgi:hypothetical protein